MNKVAIFVFADTATEEGLGRVVNALETAKEFKTDDMQLYFDGTGTKWPAELAKKDHIANKLYESISGRVAGACSFCATAFGAKEAVKAAGVKLVDEHDDHISVKKLLSEGFHIMNF
jgi:hypothetical protein